MTNIDFPTVVFASIIYIILYVVWHSKFLFGRILGDFTKKKTFSRYLTTYVAALFFCYILALLEVVFSITTFWDGVFFGFLIWLGVIFSHGVMHAITYRGESKIVFIDLALYFLTTTIICGILAG